MPITLGDTSITGITGNQGIGTATLDVGRLNVAKPAAAGLQYVLALTAGQFTGFDRGSAIAFPVSETTTTTFAYIGARVDQGAAGDNAQALVFGTHNTNSAPTEQMRITSTGLLRFNSGFGSAATAYGCRAWVNFNGTGTVAIRGSGNVSSITDRNTGRYTVNLTNAMPDTNYSAVVSGSTNNGDNVGESFQAYVSSTTAIPITSGNTSAFLDSPTVCVAIFR